MLKIYDCSNSCYRPSNRGFGGPLENEIVAYLKKYATDFSCQFVASPEQAELLFTNDVFPPGLPALPKVKRMDGVFHFHNLVYRNIALNASAQLADTVIFISAYSKTSLSTLYSDLKIKNSTVALNKADPLVFRKKPNISPSPRHWLSVCTDWSRSEKRLTDTLIWACLHPQFNLDLIGYIPSSVVLPQNVRALGYLPDYAEVLLHYDAYLSLTYRDAAPKTVGHALCAGLPCLYADSGGQAEMIENCGIGIPDLHQLKIEEQPSRISRLDLQEYTSIFVKNFKELQQNLEARAWDVEFSDMLTNYFTSLRQFNHPSRL